MRWEDERYIRIFTRDTPTWDAMGWEAQSLLMLIFRKMDRTGLLELGTSGMRGLSACVRMPIDVVERSLKVLIEDGVLSMSGPNIFCKNFMAAQECAKSDALRSKEKRERAYLQLSQSVSTAPQSVAETPRSDTSAPRSDTPSVPSVPCLDLKLFPVPADDGPKQVIPLGGKRARLAYSESFEAAWKLYGRHEEKPNAFAQWKAEAKALEGGEQELLELVTSALSWQGPIWERDGWKFAKYFERYLKRKKWTDKKPSDLRPGEAKYG
jgi:hypothetical protein